MDICGRDYSLLETSTPGEQETMTTKLKMHNNITSFSIQTRFEPNKNFVHTFVLEPHHMTSQYETWKIRNGDQLLCLGNEDATLLSHYEVLNLLETCFNTTDNNILMLYWRPATNFISETKFNETISEGMDELDSPQTETRTEWKPLRTIIIKKFKTCKYLQLSDKKVVFRELISAYPDKDECDFNQCQFQEEIKWKMEAGPSSCIRRFKYKENNNYLYVSEEGFITLDDQKSSTFEIIKGKKNPFSLLKESQSGHYLCVNSKHQNGQFVILNNTEGNLDDSFKLNIKKI